MIAVQSTGGIWTNFDLGARVTYHPDQRTISIWDKKSDWVASVMMENIICVAVAQQSEPVKEKS